MLEVRSRRGPHFSATVDSKEGLSPTSLQVQILRESCWSRCGGAEFLGMTGERRKPAVAATCTPPLCFGASAHSARVSWGLSASVAFAVLSSWRRNLLKQRGNRTGPLLARVSVGFLDAGFA